MKVRSRSAAMLCVGAVAGLSLAPTTVQAAVNYFDVTRVVSGTGTAYCPSGMKVTGGGVGTLPSDYYGSTTSDEYKLTGSYPYMTTAWKATAQRIHGTYFSSSGWRFTASSYAPRTYAVCVS